MTLTNCIVLNALLLPLASHAGQWTADPAASRVGFTATQQRAEFSGQFQRFTASIDFDPATPESGSILAMIDLATVDTQYADRDNYLREPEWFHIALFPQAKYTADSIRATASGFEAEGFLSLRGVRQAVPLTFTFEIHDDRARMQGSAKINRLAFGVGQGDWADTGWVGAGIDVSIDLELERATAGVDGASTQTEQQ